MSLPCSHVVWSAISECGQEYVQRLTMQRRCLKPLPGVTFDGNSLSCFLETIRLKIVFVGHVCLFGAHGIKIYSIPICLLTLQIN